MSKPKKAARKTQASFFPFALFGGGGAAAGAEALADAFQEMLADNERETMPARAAAYTDHVRFEEFTFAELADYDGWREQAAKAIRRAFKNNEFLLWCSGNHLGALPIYDELAKIDNALLVQFDAHLDVYNLSDCTDKLSHGNFMLHCAGRLPATINIGHRDLFLPHEHVARHFTRAFAGAELAINPQPALDAVRQASSGAAAVFIDIDCDVFDAAYFPALAQPLPFGLSPYLLLRFLDVLWSPKVLGIAFSEFESARDRNDQSLGTLLWLLEYLLLRLYEQ